MINRIRLKNFQAHADTTLDFDKGVNIIVGRSDQGKSSIIRALRWVVENRPTGTAFRKYGTDVTEVTLTIDGKDITRKRSDKINSYIFGEEEYKALRSDVPTAISEALNFGIANIQTQHEQYFLLQGSSGDAAKTINQIANLQIIGETIRNANSYVAAASHRVQTAEEVLAKAKSDVTELEWTVPLMEAVQKAQDLADKIKNARSAVSTLQSLVDTAKACAKSIADNVAPLAAQKMAQLENYTARYSKARKDVLALTHLIANAKNLMGCKTATEIEFPYKLFGQVIQVYETWRALTSQIACVKEARQAQTTAQSNYVAMRREQRQIEAQIPRCPTCGQPVKETV